MLRDACWIRRHKPLEAWTFSLPGTERKFIIPAKCLNLAELKSPPPPKPCKVPSCSLSVTTKEDDIWIESFGPGKSLKEPTLTKDGSPTKVPVIQEGEKWVAKAQGNGVYRVELEVQPSSDEVAKGCEPSRCSTTIEIKPSIKEQKSCKSPSCNLSVTTEWPENSAKGKITVAWSGTDGDPEKPTISSLDNPTSPTTIPSTEFEEPEGRYKIDLKVNPTKEDQEKGCLPSTCSTIVQLTAPPPCPTCDSAWFLRAYAAYGEGLGSEESGFLRTPNQQVGAFKLDFNQGLGGGVEVEKRLPWGAKDWKSGNWGWDLGLTHLGLDTVWTFDTPTRWHRDRDVVPTLILTTGPRYHLPKNKWDLYFGPVVGFAQLEDATFADGSVIPGTFEAGFDESFVVGADLGFDAFLGKCWGLSGGLQYLKLQTETVGIDLDVDPLILKFGVVYHIW